MSDLFKCDAHLRLIDKKLGSVSSVLGHGTIRCNHLFREREPEKIKNTTSMLNFPKREQGKVGSSKSVGPDRKSEYETRYQYTQWD